jgi:hypothetical protein
MLRTLAGSLLLASLLWAGTAVADPFVDGLEDVPLMTGLASLPDRSVTFDKPSGRIVESYAQGAVRRADVIRFYEKTLPQLGWSGKARAYRREGEELRLDFEGKDGALVVRFSLSPR